MLAFWSMKLLFVTTLALALAGAAYADPSETGLEHGQRNGWDKQDRPLIVDSLTCFKDAKDCTPVSVPDAGGTLGLLSLGMAGLAFWRFKLA